MDHKRMAPKAQAGDHVVFGQRAQRGAQARPPVAFGGQQAPAAFQGAPPMGQPPAARLPMGPPQGAMPPGQQMPPAQAPAPSAPPVAFGGPAPQAPAGGPHPGVAR